MSISANGRLCTGNSGGGRLPGVWELMLAALNECGAGLTSVQLIDSTIIRAHHQAAGAKGGLKTRVFGAQRVASRQKFISASPARGSRLQRKSTFGEVSDYKGYDIVMDAEGPKPKVLIADKGYDSDRIRDDLEAKGGVAVIPMRSGRKVHVAIDQYIYGLRNRVERRFNKLKNPRRVATRYDKTADSYTGFLHIASIRLWINHFVNSTWKRPRERISSRRRAVSCERSNSRRGWTRKGSVAMRQSSRRSATSPLSLPIRSCSPQPISEFPSLTTTHLFHFRRR